MEVLVLFSAFGGIDDTSDTIEDAWGVLDGNWGELSTKFSQTTKATKESTELEVFLLLSATFLAGLDDAANTVENTGKGSEAGSEEGAELEVLIRKSGELLLWPSPSPSSTTAGLSSTDNATDTTKNGTNAAKASLEEAAPT